MPHGGHRSGSSNSGKPSSKDRLPQRAPPCSPSCCLRSSPSLPTCSAITAIGDCCSKPHLPAPAVTGPALARVSWNCGFATRANRPPSPSPGKTLARSRIHRLILLAYAGLALGWVIEAALGAPAVSLHDEGMYGLMAVASPLGLAVLMVLALRYLFSLPVTLQANWMFQTADQEGRAAWLAAVQRFVIACGIAPVYLASLPASIAILGWLRAICVTALGLLVALLCFERLFRDWCKLPFTCSYRPGKQMVWLLLFRASVGMIYFAAIPPLLLTASGELASFLALFTGLVLLWRRWRGKRLAQWAEGALLWEEAPEADLQALHLEIRRAH